jgi:hypothetical protein
MKFFLPDWEDRLDPNFDFPTDKYSQAHELDCYQNDIYAHQLYDLSPPYDGLLISLSIFLKKIKLKNHGSNSIIIRDTDSIKKYLKIAKNSKLEVLGDCGAFSYVNEKAPPPFFETERVANIYDSLGFDYGVSVDHMAVDSLWIKNKVTGKKEKTELSETQKARRVNITLRNAKEFIDIHKERKYNFIPIGVAQGYNKRSYVNSVKELVSMGYNYIGIGALVRYSSKDILSILSEIKPELEDTRIHLFGVLRPNYMKSFEEKSVVSFDSTSYLRKAWLRSGQNYLLNNEKWYSAIRIPYSTNPSVLKGALKNGISQEELVTLEQNALNAIHDYDKGLISKENALMRIMIYDNLLSRNTKDGIDLEKRYSNTLEDKPWKKCKCKICKDIGVDVIIFRGTNRNKRRGFHNCWVFNKSLKMDE